jgi:hypothetical protein
MKGIVQLIITAWLFNINTTFAQTDYSNHVGDIAFDAKLDDPAFKVCDEKKIVQDYSVGTKFEGERKALIDYFTKGFVYKNNYSGNSGYITIRFIVNCKGESGRFRVYQLNEDFQENKFHPELVNHFLQQLKEVKGWIPGNYKKVDYDSYDHIVFKIENGKLKDVLF